LKHEQKDEQHYYVLREKQQSNGQTDKLLKMSVYFWTDCPSALNPKIRSEIDLNHVILSVCANLDEQGNC